MSLIHFFWSAFGSVGSFTLSLAASARTCLSRYRCWAAIFLLICRTFLLLALLLASCAIGISHRLASRTFLTSRSSAGESGPHRVLRVWTVGSGLPEEFGAFCGCALLPAVLLASALPN